jgi:hypothetical protein
MNTVSGRLICGFMFIAIMCPLAKAQDETITGTIASSSRNTLTVRTSSGRYELFIIERTTRKPATLNIGSPVRVISTAGDEPGVRVASDITLTNGAASTTATSEPAVPPEVRNIERDIEREAKRFQLGVRAGVALDPELVLIGAQMQVGPFFNSDLFFRPNIEFAYGEVTALFALNPEMIYRLPISSRRGRWSSYIGVGPGFNFVHQDFSAPSGAGQRVDFSDFHSDVGLNILGGIRYRSGVFTELKTSVYSRPSPTLRLIVGYNF